MRLVLICDARGVPVGYDLAGPKTGVQLVTPDKRRLGKRPPAEIAKARIRLVIESVFSNLKRQMRLEAHLAKTLGGPAAQESTLRT